MIGKNTVIKILESPIPKLARQKIKCYRVKPDNEVIIGVGESIIRYDTAWRLEDGKQVPDYLVIWTMYTTYVEGELIIVK